MLVLVISVFKYQTMAVQQSLFSWTMGLVNDWHIRQQWILDDKYNLQRYAHVKEFSHVCTDATVLSWSSQLHIEVYKKNSPLHRPTHASIHINYVPLHKQHASRTSDSISSILLLHAAWSWSIWPIICCKNRVVPGAGAPHKQSGCLPERPQWPSWLSVWVRLCVSWLLLCGALSECVLVLHRPSPLCEAPLQPDHWSYSKSTQCYRSATHCWRTLSVCECWEESSDARVQAPASRIWLVSYSSARKMSLKMSKESLSVGARVGRTTAKGKS